LSRQAVTFGLTRKSIFKPWQKRRHFQLQMLNKSSKMLIGDLAFVTPLFRFLDYIMDQWLEDGLSEQAL
jgi:hypothetical protein